MLRRFEMYPPLSPTAPPGFVDEIFIPAYLRSGRYLHELLDCEVGRNLSSTPIDVVWGHGFHSHETYRHYMSHPYHADVYDRYILRDSPECYFPHISNPEIEPAGELPMLVGYECQAHQYRMTGGLRRVVCLRTKADLPDEVIRTFTDQLGDAPRQAPQITLSVVGANTVPALTASLCAEQSRQHPLRRESRHVRHLYPHLGTRLPRSR